MGLISIICTITSLLLRAKKNKDFKLSDKIRDELKAKGIELLDTKDGTKWKKI